MYEHLAQFFFVIGQWFEGLSMVERYVLVCSCLAFAISCMRIPHLIAFVRSRLHRS